jgi:hypothetical protein
MNVLALNSVLSAPEKILDDVSAVTVATCNAPHPTMLVDAWPCPCIHSHGGIHGQHERKARVGVLLTTADSCFHRLWPALPIIAAAFGTTTANVRVALIRTGRL